MALTPSYKGLEVGIVDSSNHIQLMKVVSKFKFQHESQEVVMGNSKLIPHPSSQ